MDAVKLREWQRQDLDQIAELWFELATHVNPMDGFYRISHDARKKYKNHLDRVFGDRNHVVFVANGDAGLIGFAMGRINKSPSVVVPEKVGYIENVFVRERGRAAGIGTALCTKLLGWFRKRGVRHVELFYQTENRGAATFWKKMGFKPWLAKAYRVI
jgi:GNAT superfamily N-acetyltransferase